MQKTKNQNDFINSTAKFVRLLAPAGCGKTFSIVEKTKQILSDNPKAKIKIFTFTKNAAEEIRSRLPNVSGLDVLTLNSWGNFYIKRKLQNPKRIEDLEKRFYVPNSLKGVWGKTAYKKIYEPILSGKFKIRNGMTILDRICDFKNIGFNHTTFTKDFEKNLKEYEKHVNFIKNVNLNKYFKAARESLIRLLANKKKLNMTEQEQDNFIVQHWIPFWKDCCDEMIKTDRFLFDDQKYIANLHLNEQINKNERWTGSTKLDYIFVDEFQDISPLDLKLISNLQKLNDASLIIVGDDDQAIFEFRGASPYFILHPEEMFDGEFATFTLDENFRSPRNIVEKSMALIKNNQNRFDKVVKPNQKKTDAEIKLYEYDKSENMVDAIIGDIKNTPNDETVVILSRKKSSLLPYQVLLTKENIRYSVRADLSFFYTEPAERLKTAIQIKQNKNFEHYKNLTELICLFPKNEIFSKPKKTIQNLLLNGYCSIKDIGDFLLKNAQKYPELKFFTSDVVQELQTALDNFVKATNVYETIYALLNHFGGFKQNYFRSLDDLYYKDPPFSSLLSFASKYGDDFQSFVSDFERAIDYAKAQSDEDNVIIPEKTNVFLSTALRVKGQEFDKVIVLDTVDGIWPMRKKKEMKQDDDFIYDEIIDKQKTFSDSDDIESERRLFYVAVTRPKKELHLYRTINITDNEQSKLSVFVEEGNYNQ